MSVEESRGWGVLQAGPVETAATCSPLVDNGEPPTAKAHVILWPQPDGDLWVKSYLKKRQFDTDILRM